MYFTLTNLIPPVDQCCVTQMITASAIVYADLIFLRIQTHGFFSDDWKMTSVTEEVNQIISYCA